ncbi:MAG: ribose 5-phosphate isomerase B [Chloroflexi bacterium]|nr:MAG: ribose 5-phosphate isomerase B [Chloroflexota bacterium]
MNIAIASDHAGFPLKQELARYLREKGHTVLDLGVDTDAVPADYPDAAYKVGQAIIEGQAERGVLICGSGVGASIAANKMTGIYAAICHDTYSAHQGVEHDNMNVLCLGARVIGVNVARELVDAFLSARFSGEERHNRRFNKLRKIEQGQTP